jgi:hypothetical protein
LREFLGRRRSIRAAMSDNQQEFMAREAEIQIAVR